MGTILFTLYMLPLGHILNDSEDSPYHCYADDIQLYISNSNLYPNQCSKNLMELKTVLICAPDNFVPRVIENHGPISASLLPIVRNLRTLLIRHSVLKGSWLSCANVFLSSLPVSDILSLSVN